jgi:hypothetical protein
VATLFCRGSGDSGVSTTGPGWRRATLALKPRCLRPISRLRQRPRCVGDVARARGLIWLCVVLRTASRLERAGKLEAVQAADGLRALSELPIERHEIPPLLLASWPLRNKLRLVDAL